MEYETPKIHVPSKYDHHVLTGEVEKINPKDVLKYDTSHAKTKSKHLEAYLKITEVHEGDIKKIVPGVVERVQKETHKLTKK